MNQFYFDHEKLSVYQRSVEFVKYVNVVNKKIKLKISILEQLDRASDSIALNIAERNGKIN